VALVIGFGRNPAGLALHLFTFALTLTIMTAFLAGRDAPWGGRLCLPTIQLLSTIVALQGVLPVLLQDAPSPALLTSNESRPPLWRASFREQGQALSKDLALPNDWRDQPVFVRIDLAARYDGSAGFRVEANDQPLGRVGNDSPGPPFVGTFGYVWAVRIPLELLERSPFARVVLRPDGIDPALAVAGHPDLRVDPFVPGNSRFFTGTTWLPEQLAGPDSPRTVGTYRIWLLTQRDPHA
jgi:hypothetical protein